MEPSYDLFFKSLSSSTRLKIVEYLRGKMANVNAISMECDLEQSRVSHSLRILEVQGIVSGKREGRNVFYSLDENIEDSLAALDKYMAKYGKKLKSCGIVAGKKDCRHLKR
jgi:DNA-binding transcriptional ArsR family regulator